MKIVTRILTILVIAFWAGSLCAMPIVVTDPTGTILLRVDGLEVNDTLLDVTFAPGSFDDVFGAGTPPAISTPYYLGDGGIEAFTFGTALAALLNSSPIGSMAGVPITAIGSAGINRAIIPNELFDFGPSVGANSMFYQTQFGTPGWIGAGRFTLPNRATPLETDRVWAVITVNSVPTPATLALFGLGLAGLSWKRRKKA